MPGKLVVCSDSSSVFVDISKHQDGYPVYNQPMTFRKTHPESSSNKHLKHSIWWFLAAMSLMSFGSVMAARYYPGEFDWPYTVASALASQKHNPSGSGWFASTLSLSMVLLWLYVSHLKQGLYLLLPSARFAIGAIRVGLVSGALVGIERLLIYDLSKWIDKVHEILALITFMGLYFGVLGLLFQIMLHHRRYIAPVLLIASPLLAIGISQFWLYLDQRDLGWVDASWREKGIPIWLSFAFWQWLAIGFLWAGLALLYIFTSRKLGADTEHFGSE